MDEVFYHEKIFTLLLGWLYLFFAHLCIFSSSQYYFPFFQELYCYSKSLWSIIKSEREYLRRMRHARPRKAATTIQITTMRITIKLDIAATPKKFTLKCLDVSIILKNCSILFLPIFFIKSIKTNVQYAVSITK